MNGKTFSLAMGEVDERFITEALNYQCKAKRRPLWAKIARTAAIILLTITLSLGALVAFSPSARAAVLAWVREVYETYILYRYTGESGATLPEYEIATLPQGYRENKQNGNDDLNGKSGFRIYENPNGDRIKFSYVAMEDGAVSQFSADGADVMDVKVMDCDGSFFQSKDPAKMNTLTWMDTKRGVQFSIDGYFSYEDFMRMAESID